MRPDWNIAVDEAVETQAALGLDGLKARTRSMRPPRHRRRSTRRSTRIAYEKGAAVLRMIENYLGPDTFRKGINAYLQAHAYGNGTSQDFWNAMAAASGKPIDKILPTFVNQPGAPLVDVSLACARQPHRSSTVAQQRFFVDPRCS